MKTCFYSILFSLFFAVSMQAQYFSKEDGALKLPVLISDNMVLQQLKNVRIWGESGPEMEVTVTTSWNKESVKVKTKTNGRWEIRLMTPPATFNPQKIIVKSGNKQLEIENILIGEVWLCSGQSNMQMPLSGFPNCPIDGGNKDIALSGLNTSLRYYTVKRVAEETPKEYSQGKGWEVCNPQNSFDFGAAAYYFGTMLAQVLQVPVGIINCSWGGSKVEGWLPREMVEMYEDIKIGAPVPFDYLQPCIMFNGMLNGVSKYTVKGFIWYQGESNVGCPDYAERLAAMVELWRKMWGDNELPFYEVEIAPFQYGNEKSAYLREQQFKAQQLIPKSGMISTNDLVQPYEEHQIHPMEKRKIGERLCFMALADTYEMPNIVSRGPEYDRMETNGSDAYIFFKNAFNGFNRIDGIIGFEIAGDDRIFYPATAFADWQKNCIVVSAPEVKVPVAVRYCFHDFQIGNLANGYQLPAVPFRTDNW